eukprot:Hpha_TRINITY_DN15782_c1_g3::TRINITY_DN15782_c1_g3_i4::g.39676::m.39676
MPTLRCKIISGKGFCDISPAPGCCGKPVPSMPLAFFTLHSAGMTWATGPAQLRGETVTWNKEFSTVQCREPESDRLHIAVVDGAHWRPVARGKQNMAVVPLKHLYGEVMMSVIQFERAKAEVQELTLKARNGNDTGYMIKVEGEFQDDNIDDHRIGIHQVPVGPPQENFKAVAPGVKGSLPSPPNPYGIPPKPPIVTAPKVEVPAPPTGGYNAYPLPEPPPAAEPKSAPIAPVGYTLPVNMGYNAYPQAPVISGAMNLRRGLEGTATAP